MRLENKSVVVTGASSGMGDAIVRLFAQEGANVVAVARRKERLDALVADLADAPGRVIAYVGDVSDDAVDEGMVDAAVSEFGRLDVLVNNAGIMDHMDPVADLEDDLYRRVMDVNLYGPMCAMRKAVRTFRGQGGGGAIVNVASIGATRAAAGPAYCASKAGLVALTRNTAYMYIADGIRANAIAPGGISTEIGTAMGQPNMDGYNRISKVLACAPAPGRPIDIAHAALFLASDEASYVSGDVLVVDGGWTAG